MKYLVRLKTIIKCSRISNVFFFQAEDGIRDVAVTGVQTCALPISVHGVVQTCGLIGDEVRRISHGRLARLRGDRHCEDRKSTRLNSSHGYISYAVFCLKKKKKNNKNHRT